MHDTTDPTADPHDSATDPTDDGLSVNEAAERLGISSDAVRARIRRGTLRAAKQGNLWTVSLSDTTRHDAPPDANRTVARQTVTDRTVVPGTDPASTSALRDHLHHLEGEIDYLRTELAKRSQELATERERADVLQREALGRIEAIEATVSAADTSQTDTYRAPSETSAEGILARLRRWFTGGARE